MGLAAGTKLGPYEIKQRRPAVLVNTKVDEPNAAPLSIVLNWASEMEK
jgi:hypothetical protein